MGELLGIILPQDFVGITSGDQVFSVTTRFFLSPIQRFTFCLWITLFAVMKGLGLRNLHNNHCLGFNYLSSVTAALTQASFRSIKHFEFQI